MTFDERDVEKMLRSMFFIGALDGAFLASHGQWNYETIKKYENAYVKFLIWRQKQKGK
jgi:hypothetical protein